MGPVSEKNKLKMERHGKKQTKRFSFPAGMNRSAWLATDFLCLVILLFLCRPHSKTLFFHFFSHIPHKIFMFKAIDVIGCVTEGD
jgi:hypothetical protein